MRDPKWIATKLFLIGEGPKPTGISHDQLVTAAVRVLQAPPSWLESTLPPSEERMALLPSLIPVLL